MCSTVIVTQAKPQRRVISPWVLTDAKTDVRSLANPLVAGEFGLRFYMGIPL